MKRFVVYLLLAALCLSVVACGDPIESETTSAETTAGESEVTTLPDIQGDETESRADTEAETKDSENEPDVTVGETTSENETAESETAESTTAEVITTESEESVKVTDDSEQSDTVEGSEDTDGTDATEESEESEEIETEDPRLSAEYAPVTYFDAKAIYELTQDGVYEDLPSHFFGYDEVTYHKEKGQRAYTKIKTWNDLQTAAEAYISLCTAPMDVAPIFAVKYRTTTPGLSMEIYTDSVNGSVTSGNIVRLPVTSDGEWHVEYVNLSAIKQFNGATVNYFRFDIMNASKLPVDSYMDFEYFGFFASDDEVEMFETGKYVPVIYVDENSEYKHNTTITHASSIDMINGAGGIGATKFDYRGGNSATGIDKFNHNATTLSGGKLVFSGWTVVDGGVEKFVWSIDGLTWYEATLHKTGGLGDGNQAHIEATEKYTGEKITDTVNSVKGCAYQGNIGVNDPEDRAKGLACDLLKAASYGDTVNVRFAAVPKNAPGELCLIAYVKGVTIVEEFGHEEETEPVETFAPDMIEPEDCEEHNVSVYWYPVEGEATENKLCLLCGEAVESRSVAFYSSFDLIEHNGSNISGGYGANKVIEKDGSGIVLRSGYDFVVQGWFACNGGVKDYMYSVDGGETWLVCGNSDKLTDKFRPEHVDAIERAALGIAKYDVKGMYRVNLPLKQFASENEETTVNVLFGAKLANNESVVITIANITNVKIPAAPASGNDPTPDPDPVPTTKFDKSTDNIYVGATTFANPAGNVSGKLFTFDASNADVSANKTVRWQGWAAIEGGFSKWAYSLDGGKTWIDFTSGYSDTTRPDVIGHITNNLGYTDATKNGNINLSVDLSAYNGQTVSVIFGGYAVNDPETVIPMVEIKNIKVAGACTHVGENWMPVEGQLKETINCDDCGETVTRDVTFVVSLDNVAYSGGNRGWVATYVGSEIYVVNNVAVMPVIAGKGLTVLGWVGLNGGVSAYKWSIDGETWHDAGAGYYHNTGIYGAVNEHNIGIADFTDGCQFNLDLTGLCDLDAGTYTVYFGAVPANNTSVVVPFVAIHNVFVNKSPEAADALKTINGTAVSEYTVVYESADHSSKAAARELVNQMFVLSGRKPTLGSQGSAGAKTICIKMSDQYSAGRVSVGEYFFEISGNNIVIGGSGAAGIEAALNAFVEILKEGTDVTVISRTKNIAALENTKAKLEDGSLKVGFIGDSVTFGHGPVTPWPTYFGEQLSAEYASADISYKNVAVAGMKSTWAEENIKELLLDTGYTDLIFIAIGTNDQFQIGDSAPLTYEQTYANYVSMIEQIYDVNPDCDIVLVMCTRDFEAKGLVGTSDGSVSPFMRAMLDVAEEYGISVIEPMTVLYEACLEYSPADPWGEGWKHYMQDEVHPNAIGQELYGDVVFQYVLSAIK